MKCSEEEQWRLRCEQLENEAWSNIGNFKDELRGALESKKPTEEQQYLINAAAGVALMHIDVVDAEGDYFGLDDDPDPDPDLIEAESDN
jgi:hypothetical protein